MKIILNQDVIHVGEEGDVVVVKDGYARNYLLPNNMAVIYNKANAARFKARAKQIEEKKVLKREQSALLMDKLNELVVDLVVPASESGKLFGSVTSQMVQEALNKEGYEVDRKKIDVQSHTIKMVGQYSVLIHLYENDSAHIKINVKSEAQQKAEEKQRAEEEKKRKKEEEEKRKAEEEAAKAKEEAEAQESEAADQEVPEEVSTEAAEEEADSQEDSSEKETPEESEEAPKEESDN